MNRAVILVVFLASFAPVFSQQRIVVRTNRQGQILRLTVATNNRILRQQVIGTLEARPLQQQQAQPQQRQAPQAAPQPQQRQAPQAAPQPQQRQVPAIQNTNVPVQRVRTPLIAPAPVKTATHMVGFSFDFLLQNGLTRFSTQLDPADINTAYAGALPYWGSGNLGFGLSFGLNYAYAMPNYLSFLFQLQLDSTGWAFVGMNFGMGLRAPIHPKFNLLVDVYFGLGFTGADLPPLAGATVPVGNPSSVLAIVGLIGFKSRVALEFHLPKNMYFILAVSYAAYPWGFSTAGGSFAINGVTLGRAIVADAFKVGFEVGWKINGKPKRQK